MKWYAHFGEWLLRFASSQRNIDRVAAWLGGTILVAAAALVGTVALMLIRR